MNHLKMLMEMVNDFCEKLTTDHHHHHHHISVMELGHLLTRSGLPYPEVSSKSTTIPSPIWTVVFHYPG